MTPRAQLQAYITHHDPATATANLLAMIVGWNAPFYPLYVIAFAGRSVAGPAMLTGIAAPFFLAIPAIARRSSRMARFALPVVGALNTLWCTKVLGTSCGLELFLLPCVLLSALLCHPDERGSLLSAALISVASNFIPDSIFGTPIISLSAIATRHLATLNEGSVLFLCLIMTWQFAKLMGGGIKAGP